MTTNRIKIVHIVSGLDAGGTEMMLYKLLSRISPEHFDNAVISLTDSANGYVGKKIRELGIPVHSLSMKRGGVNPIHALKLPALLYSLKPDILQTWLYHSDLLGTIAYLVSPAKKLCWNIRCSGIDYKAYSKLTELSIRALSKLSFLPDAVLVNSLAGKAHHESLGYHPKKWEWIPNGFDLNEFQPDPQAKDSLSHSLSLPEGARIIGMVARFDPIKDHATFLKAANALLKKRSDVHFVLVGKGVTTSNPEIAAFVAEPESRKRIHLLGERSDVATLMAGFDIFSLTSQWEGFPNVIGEAMSCGVPSVSTRAGDAEEIIGDTGQTVPVGNPEALEKSWEALLSLPPDELKLLGTRARSRIRDKYLLSNIVKRYETLYSGLLIKS